MAANLNKSMKRNKDEYYTPKILVDIILPFVRSYIDGIYSNWYPGKPIPKIWCPFDKLNSEFVLALKEKFNDCEIISSHISEDGGDFFEKIETIGHVDLVLSNPPFSKKLEIIQKLNEKNIRFALLLNVECINYQIMGNYFAENPISLIIPDKKVSFDGHTTSFCSGYFCSPDFIEQYSEGNIKFVHCEHNNTGKNFKPSRMYEQ